MSEAWDQVKQNCSQFIEHVVSNVIGLFVSERNTIECIVWKHFGWKHTPQMRMSANVRSFKANICFITWCFTLLWCITFKSVNSQAHFPSHLRLTFGIRPPMSRSKRLFFIAGLGWAYSLLNDASCSFGTSNILAACQICLSYSAFLILAVARPPHADSICDGLQG